MRLAKNNFIRINLFKLSYQIHINYCTLLYHIIQIIFENYLSLLISDKGIKKIMRKVEKKGRYI